MDGTCPRPAPEFTYLALTESTISLKEHATSAIVFKASALLVFCILALSCNYAGISSSRHLENRVIWICRSDSRMFPDKITTEALIPLKNFFSHLPCVSCRTVFLEMPLVYSIFDNKDVCPRLPASVCLKS